MSGNRLGTPLNKQQSAFSRSDAPSPITPGMHKSMPSGLSRNERSTSPLKLKRGPAVPNKAEPTSPAQSAAPSAADSQVQQNNELKDELARLRARTRIVADPSISTSFKREDDPELYELFLT
ncbi:hypothetical protein ACM66B_002585 [Microbotryomycetes sp. NB124-2]